MAHPSSVFAERRGHQSGRLPVSRALTSPMNVDEWSRQSDRGHEEMAEKQRSKGAKECGRMTEADALQPVVATKISGPSPSCFRPPQMLRGTPNRCVTVGGYARWWPT